MALWSSGGRITPVEITVFEDRSFTFITKTPPAAVLIKEALGLESLPIRIEGFDVSNLGGEHTVAAGQLFLCLGAVNTTELLLRCRDQHRTLTRLSPSLGSGYSANRDFLAFGLGTSPPFETTNGPTITTASVYDEQRDGQRHRLMVQDGGYSPQLSHLMPLMSPPRLTRLVGRDLANRVGRQTRTFASLREEAVSLR